MSGDRHVGVPRCLHPTEQRELIVETEFGVAHAERCLACRAVRRRLPKRPSLGRGVGWGPWISAAAQVQATLERLAAPQGNTHTGQLSLAEWSDLLSKK